MSGFIRVELVNKCKETKGKRISLFNLYFELEKRNQALKI